MKKSLKSLLVGLATTAALATSASAERVLVYATGYSDTATLTQIDHWFMNEVERRSNGEITFERYTSGTLLGLTNDYAGLAAGAADMVSGNPSAYNPNTFRLSNLVQPFVSSDLPAVANALAATYADNEEFQQEFRGQGAHLLYMLPAGENTFWSARPLATPGDFAGLRVRSVQSIAAGVRKLGGTPVAMQWGEAVDGLARGVIDVMGSTPFDSATLFNIFESATVGSDGGGFGIFSFFSASLSVETWDSLSEEHQQLLSEVAAEVRDEYVRMMDVAYDNGVETLCSYTGDLTISLFSDEDRAEIAATVGREIEAEWVAFASEGGANAQALLDQYMENLRRYEAESDWLDGFARYVERGC